MGKPRRGLSQLELQSTLELKKLIGDIFSLLSEGFGGDITVNQMRIGHYIGLQSLYKGLATSNTDISAKLGIPRSTVSRIVADCVAKGWVIEEKHPDDGRKKLLRVSAAHPNADSFEIHFRHLLNQVLRQAEANNIVVVTGDEKGF